MKVLHICTYDTGGAAIGAIRQHLALLNMGINSKILFLENHTPNIPQSYYYHKTNNRLKTLLRRLGFFKTKAEIERIRIRKLGKTFKEGGTFELFSSPFSNFKDLSTHPLVEEAEIINLHWISEFVDIPSFLKNIKVPLVWTLHDMQPYLGGFHYDIDLNKNKRLYDIENEYVDIKKIAFHHNIKFSIVGNSKWNTSLSIESKVFEGAAFFETIYYAINKNLFFPIEKSAAKKALNLPEDKVIIGFACEDLQNPRKGFDLLINAINLLSIENKQRITCLAFGRENNTIVLDGVELIQLGSISNPKFQRLSYAAMDAFVIPSLAEAFGLTALESMYCGTPVIGANVGGIPELVHDKITGFLFTAGNAKSLANVIAAFISNHKEFKITEKGHEILEKNHNPKKVASNYINIYKNLLLS